MSLSDKPHVFNRFSTLKAGFFIAGFDGVVTHIGFDRQYYPLHWVYNPDAFQPEISDLIRFFNGEIKKPDIEYELFGTDFQTKVWQTISQIPYGETRSYKEVAMMAGYPGAARAVGNACNKNCLLLAVPCHRVVAANGLGGYGGNLDAKIWLLDIEQQHKER